MPLLWFHAFRRRTIDEVVEVLRVGSRPPPLALVTETREHEVRLGLASSVYAYLGRTLECFGDAAVAVALEAANGHVSPFDTGGLVSKIKPVCDWNDDAKKKYLDDLTWETNALAALLDVYPGPTVDGVRTYLQESRPPHPGPHELWEQEEPVAAIWESNDDWRAWTWESRSEHELPTGHYVVRWSCTVPIYQKFIAFAESVTDPVLQDWLEQISAKYVEGGVSRLLRELRNHQEAA